VLTRAFDRAVEAKVNPVSVQQIFHTLVEMSEERQRECQGDGNLP
jgi:chorismate mutase